MLKNTNIDYVKNIAINFLNIEPVLNHDFPILVNHPFFEYVNVYNGTKFINIYDDEYEFRQLRIDIFQKIRQTDSLFAIIAMIRKSYRLTFLKFIKDKLSLYDFSKALSEIYVDSEDPNNDVNVSVRLLASWFKQADKATLMNENEYEMFVSLPENLTVYRGVAVGRKKNGLSWTTDLAKARWFSERFNKENQKGYILATEINKSDVLAYFSRRNESEVVCKPKVNWIIQL